MADDNDTPQTHDAEKPAPRRRAPRKAPAKSTAAKTPAKTEAAPKPAAKAKAPPKPRSTKRATPRPATKTAKATDAAKKSAGKAVDKVGGKWGAAAIATGLVAVAGTAATLLTLRGSTPKGSKPTDPKGGAHQPDGKDSSRSFEAGIADEGTIPDA